MIHLSTPGGDRWSTNPQISRASRGRRSTMTLVWSRPPAFSRCCHGRGAREARRTGPNSERPLGVTSQSSMRPIEGHAGCSGFARPIRAPFTVINLLGGRDTWSLAVEGRCCSWSSGSRECEDLFAAPRAGVARARGFREALRGAGPLALLPSAPGAPVLEGRVARARLWQFVRFGSSWRTPQRHGSSGGLVRGPLRGYAWRGTTCPGCRPPRAEPGLLARAGSVAPVKGD